MGKIVRIQKTLQSEAILPSTPEEEGMVRQWFAEYFEAMGHTQEEAYAKAAEIDFEEVKTQHLWVARDIGSKIIYFIPPASFLTDFEEVSEDEIPSLAQDLKFLEDFKFPDSDSK